MPAKIPHQSPLRQIRHFCLACHYNQPSEVRFCSDPGCALWFLRFGRSPKRVIKEQGSQAEKLFEPENFRKGSKFDPDKEVRSLKSLT